MCWHLASWIRTRRGRYGLCTPNSPIYPPPLLPPIHPHPCPYLLFSCSLPLLLDFHDSQELSSHITLPALPSDFLLSFLHSCYWLVQLVNWEPINATGSSYGLGSFEFRATLNNFLLGGTFEKGTYTPLFSSLFTSPPQ